MTGDGVNDVLAFKEADCSIAMASGSDAAKNAANLVLLDNNFNAMPHIVDEGRRVINNITMSASMFLIKTIFSALISITTKLSLISACGVGIPTFFLTYEANFAQVKGNFLKNVLERSFPSGFIIALGATLITNIGLLLGYEPNMLSTVCILFTGWNYTIALLKVYKIIIYTTQLIYYISMIIGQSILELTDVTFNWLMVLLALIAFSSLLVDLTALLFKQLEDKYIKYK